jgi:hypothetical protein
VLLSLGAITLVAGIFGGADPDSDETVSLSSRLAVIAVGVVLTAVGVPALRAFRRGVFVDENGVVVREWFRAERLQWDEIGAFSTVPLEADMLPRLLRSAARRAGYGLGEPVLVIELASGSRRVLSTMSGKAPGLWLGDKPPEIARTLNAARPTT